MKIKFMKEFKRMKQYIQNQQNAKGPNGGLKLTFAALEGHTQQIQEIKSEVKGLRENTLYAIECEEITRAVKSLGVMLLGGKIQILIRISSLEGSYIEIFIVSYIGNLV